MAARVYDDTRLESPDYRCRACGINVRAVIAFDGYGKGWQACFDCIADAARALDEHHVAMDEEHADQEAE